MLSVTLPASTVKRLAVGKGDSNEKVTSQELKFQRNSKLQVSVLKLRVANYNLNLGLQFGKNIAG